MSKFFDFLRKFYLIIFALCFCAGGLLEFCLGIAWQPRVLIIVGLICAVVCLIYVGIIRKGMPKQASALCEKLKSMDERKLVFLILMVGVVLRVAYYIWADFIPTTDFQHGFDFYNYVEKYGPYTDYVTKPIDRHVFQEWFADYPAWGAYLLVEWFVLSTFGNSFHYVFVMNLLLYVGTSVILYLALRRAVKRSTALLSIVVFSIFPQVVFWCSETTPDHLVIFFLALFILLWQILYERSDIPIRKNIGWILAMALAMACVDLFKPLKPLTLCIILAAELFIRKNENYNARKRIAEIIICSIVYLLLTNMFTQAIDNRLEDMLKTDVSQITPFYLMAGYTLNENGIVDSSLAMKNFFSILDAADTKEEGMEIAYEKAREVIRSAIPKLPIIWAQKYVILFGRDRWAFTLTFNNESKQYPELFISLMEALLTIINAVSLFLVGLSSRNKRIPIIEFLSVGFLGYIAYLVVGAGLEARYRYIFILAQCVLTVIGVGAAKELIGKIKKRDEGLSKAS